MSGIYVASRVKHAEMWRLHRNIGCPIGSTWIDSVNTGDMAERWEINRVDVLRSEALLFYAVSEDFPLKGAFVEVGVALGCGVPIVVCMPGVVIEAGSDHPVGSDRPVGSWIRHKSVTLQHDCYKALRLAESYCKEVEA